MKTEKTTQTIELTIEKSETFIVHTPGKIFSAWCSACRNDVSTARPDDAARLAGMSTRAIYAGIEAGQVHFSESQDGTLFVCIDSLSQPADQAERLRLNRGNDNE